MGSIYWPTAASGSLSQFAGRARVQTNAVKVVNRLTNKKWATRGFVSTVNADGVVRVGGTRVTLDTVVRAFLRGTAAEGIAQQYRSLSLADV